MEAAEAEENSIIAEMDEIKVKLKEAEDLFVSVLQKKNRLEKRYEELDHKRIHCLELRLHSKKWDSTDFEWSAEIENVLHSTFKLEKFRLHQLSAINAVMSKQDCLLLMPTGGGKSLCYQLPAKVLKGFTLVVSPLVSLMEDQVMALKDLDFPAVMLNASTDPKQSREVMKSMTSKDCPHKIIYVTPERLSKSKTLLSSIQKAYQCDMFSLLAIDEVHCCSQWGHDFRQDYKILGIMKRQYPTVPILGVTATATPEILSDVKKFLRLETCLTFKVPFDRPNLKYRVLAKPSNHKDLLKLLVDIIKEEFDGLSGIIYCFSIKESEQTAEELRQEGINASCYHAQLSAEQRSKTHKKWVKNQIQIVVATVAFGMGIDKPDVRFIIHHTLPKAMESYYQESGRAGRDDKPAECILLYNFADIFRLSTMVNQDPTALKKLYDMINYCIDLTSCRRVLIAKQFNEDWEKDDCDQMCDHCSSKKSDFYEKDMKSQCSYIFSILSHCKSKNKQITGPKLVNICIGKAESNLRPMKTFGPIISQVKYERLITLMLLKAYLKETFSFTPYTVLSYIQIGDKIEALSGLSKAQNISYLFTMPGKQAYKDCQLSQTKLGRKPFSNEKSYTSKRQKTSSYSEVESELDAVSSSKNHDENKSTVVELIDLC